MFLLKWGWCWLDLKDLEGAKESVRITSTLRAFANFRARLYMVNACYDVFAILPPRGLYEVWGCAVPCSLGWVCKERNHGVILGKHG